MNFRKAFTLYAAVFFFAIGNAADFFVVRGNQADCSILLPEKSPNPIISAVHRFNQTLKTITGAQLPVITEDAPGRRITFLIRKLDSLKTADNFAITFPDERTMRIEGTEYSVEWALNHIIRVFAGAEWLFPESCGLSYTPLNDLIIPAEKVEVRDISWPLARVQNTSGAFPILNYRDGLLIGHAMTQYPFPLEKYGKDNSWPEAIMPVLNGKKITALPDPKRPNLYWQPCYSNPETAKIAVENILEYLKNHPDTLAMSLGSNDNQGFCECEECLKLDNGERSNRSESYFTFINRVMAEVCREYPNLMVSVYAYDQTYLPPSFELHPNAVPFLTIDFNSCVSPVMLEKHKKIIDEWGKKASHLGVWDYSWGHPYPVPRMYLQYHLGLLKYMFERNGCTYRGQCWTADCHEGPKLYLISKFLWDSNQDMKKLENEWYVRCVGEKAAPYLKAYYKVWNDYYTGDRVMQTPWFQSAPATYMSYYDYSNIYGLRESDIQAADAAMKQVVALAETAQEKERADLLALHWRYSLLRLRMLGAGIYDFKGYVQTADDALRLLDTVEKFSTYQEEYRQIGEIVSRDPLLRRYYLRRDYRGKGSPVGVEESLGDRVISHIVEASKFAGKSEVNRRMKQIAADPGQSPAVRLLCNTLSNDLNTLTNLLPGGNAEQGLPPLFNIYEKKDGENSTLSVSSDFKSEGGQSFRVSIKDPYTLLWIPVKAKPSTIYMVTFNAYIPKTSAEGYLQALLLPEKNGRCQLWYNAAPLKLAGGIWSSFSVVGTTRPDSDTIRLRIHLRNFEKDANVYFDEIRLLELGSAYVGNSEKDTDQTTKE